MNKIEQRGWDQRYIEPRSFAHYEPDTGTIIQVHYCQIPPAVEGLAMAVFDNVEWSIAVAEYRVDLASVREVVDDHPYCELVKKEMRQ